MGIRVAINGFGRIGRTLFRVLLQNPEVEIVAINDLHEERILSHLLRYDSVHGRFTDQVETGTGWMKVGDSKVAMIRQPDPLGLPWKRMDIDLVIEATGIFTAKGQARKHLMAGAKRVLVSAPSDDADVTLVLGVNEDTYDKESHLVVSNASCTTNCLAPIVKVLDEKFGVEKGLVTTVHSYTNDQSLLDNAHYDLRRARAAALSIIPTSTGAAKAVSKVLPHLDGKLDGVSVRVPVADVSLADITLSLKKPATPDDVNDELARASGSELSGIISYSDEPLVSCDHRGALYSAIVDGIQTRVVDGDMVKITAWYDNEWGYANRISEMINYIC